MNFRSLISILVLIVFILILIALSTTLAKKNNDDINFSYNDMTSIQEVNFKPIENKYYILFYYEDCKFCELIKPDTIAFHKGVEKIPEIGFYIADIYNEEVYNKMVYYGLNYGTPTLVEIDNGQLISEYVGAIDVPNKYYSVLDEYNIEY